MTVGTQVEMVWMETTGLEAGLDGTPEAGPVLTGGGITTEPDATPVLTGGGITTEPDDSVPVLTGGGMTTEPDDAGPVAGPVGTPVLAGGQTVVE